jgi:Tol biopolymer transport system component
MRLELLIVLVFGVSFGIWGANVSAGAEPSYTIAFAHFGPRNSDLFLADADGKNAKPLVPHAENDYNASFSADGKWVVFTSHRDGSADIWRVHPDGTGLERLTDDPAFDDQAALSPDGAQLAFVSNRGGHANLWLLELATKNVTQLTKHDSGDFRPAWSPNGQWIAFSSDRDSKKPKSRAGFVTLHSAEIYLIRPDGTGLRRVTQEQKLAGSPTWSRDGRRLVIYEAELAEVDNIVAVRRLRGVTQITTIEVPTGERSVVTSGKGEKWSPRWLAEDRVGYVSGGPEGGIEFTKGDAGARGVFNNPCWSPDGRRVVFHREVGADWLPARFRDWHSRDPQFRLIRTGIFPSYSPTGDRLICNSEPGAILRNNVLLGMNADGSNRSVLFKDAEKSPIAAVWSPKGDRIAVGLGRFFQMRDGPAVADIAVMDADGKNVKVLTDGKGNHGFPSWSPDGKRIVYRSSDGKTGDLFILDVEMGRSNELKTGTTMANFPAWSPTEDLIAFTTYQGGDYEICAIKSDGTGFKRLTHAPGNDAHCAWSPDGQWIAFTSARGGFQDEAALHPYNAQPYGQIHVMRADGSDVRRLTDDAYEHGTVAFVPLPEAKPGPR